MYIYLGAEPNCSNPDENYNRHIQLQSFYLQFYKHYSISFIQRNEMASCLAKHLELAHGNAVFDLGVGWMEWYS